MTGNLLETLIGALVLAVAGGFLVYAYNHSDMKPIPGYELTAKFDQVNGLTVGSDVRMSGIRIGSVLGQRLDYENFLAVVRLSIDNEVQLPDDSSAKITSDGLLGGSYLSIEPGGSPDVLMANDEIIFTQGSIDIVSLLGQAIYSFSGPESEAPVEP